MRRAEAPRGSADVNAWIGIGAPLVAPMLIGLCLWLHSCLGCGFTLNSREPEFWDETAPLIVALALMVWQTFWAVRLLRSSLLSTNDRQVLIVISLYALALVAIFTPAHFGLPSYPYAAVAVLAAWAPAAILLITSMGATVKAHTLAFWPSYLIFAPLVHVGVRLLRHGFICGDAHISELNIRFLPYFQAPWVAVGLGFCAVALAGLATRAWIANGLGWKLAAKAIAVALPLTIGAGYFLYASAIMQAEDLTYDCFGGAGHAHLPLLHLFGPFWW